jgi:hypothetical protein
MNGPERKMNGPERKMNGPCFGQMVDFIEFVKKIVSYKTILLKQYY